MSTTVTISPSDVSTAADFLEQFLTDQVPDGDFSRGTALRDLSVQAIAAVVAFLRADAAQIRQMQSLVTVEAAVNSVGGDAQALTDAVTAILSNFFVAPKSGTFARGFAIGHASQQVDIFIAVTIRFTYSRGIVFAVDSADTLFIPKSELVPIVQADGSIVDYEFRIPLVAVAPGETYNIAPGLFAAFDRFNPYVTRVENTATFAGGRGAETISEILARAPTVVAVRNLINARSIIATLDDNFEGIQNILVVGMGDPEMQRDIVPTIAPNLKFHIGGAVDIYLRTALVETSFTGSVGGLFARPDGISTVFRDGAVSFASVLPGDIIRVTAGFPTTPAEFLVVENAGTSLIVSNQSPFPIATDEAAPPTTVSYVIGRIGPTYNDVVFDLGGLPYTTGSTSRKVATSGRITLPGGPVMDILDVAIINPAAPEAAFKSTLDGFVHFPNQVNQAPQQTATPTQGLQFQTIVHAPLQAQSALQWMEVVVGTDSFRSRFDTYLLRVRYRTLQTFASIDAFVRSPRERVSAAFQLPRGHHPVAVSMVLTYTLKATAASTLDNTAIAQTIVDYVNTFDATAASIDVAAIIQLVMNTYPDIGNIVPSYPGYPILRINYALRAPTGDVLTYSTADAVSIDLTKQTAGPVPPTWTFNGEPVTLDSLGVTNRTLRYIANTTTIVATQAGT
jgi:hypothetical protein